MEDIVKKAATHLSIAESTSIGEMLAMLNYDAELFNDLVDELDNYDIFLVWIDQPEGVAIWDGRVNFDGVGFVYSGNTQPQGDGESISVGMNITDELEIS